MSLLSLSNNSGRVEMWKCGSIPSLSLSSNSGSVEVWKCGNMSLSSNSGSVEMWKCEICLHCLHVVTLEVCVR